MTPEQQQRIKDVAKQIQDILIENKMAMTPTISIGLVEEEKGPELYVPPTGIVTPENAKEKDPLFEADFMQTNGEAIRPRAAPSAILKP